MTSSSNRQQAIALLEKLEDDRLPDAIAALEALHQPLLRVTNPDDADLIEVINYRLPQRQRLQVLRLRLESDILTEKEREELLELADATESQDAERAREMFELATLRGVDLMEIVQDFRDAIAVNYDRLAL